jgi:thiamine-phosphate pyrophosphorylase
MAADAKSHHDGLAMLANGLYAIVDVDLTLRAGYDVLSFSDAVLAARPAVLQLRAKTLGARDHLGLLREIVPRAESRGVPLYANDRPDLAILAGCTGVHVGQSDVSVADLRQLSTSLRVGLSTANSVQLLEALSAKPDYIAVGPVFATGSKLDAEPAVGMDFLAYAAQLTQDAGIPLVAIGGIGLGCAAAVARFGALGSAISALIAPEQRLDRVTALTRELHEALGGK